MTVKVATGWEHGTTPASIAAGLYDDYSNIAGWTPQTTIKHSGSYAIRCNPGGSASSLLWNVGVSVLAVRVYIYFATLPSGDCGMVYGYTAATTLLSVRYRSSTTSLSLYNGSSYVDISTVTTGVWYRLDVLFDVSSNPNTVKARVDGGTEASHSIAQAGYTYTRVALALGAAVTGDVYFDDLLVTDTSGDYPLGAGGTELVKPASDGTHNNAANILEDQAGNDIDGSTYTAYSLINDIPVSGTTYVRQAANGSTNYVEVNFGNMTASNSGIHGAVATLAYTSATTTANNGACMVSTDGFSTSTEVWGTSATPQDYSDGTTSAPYFKRANIASATTEALVNALTARMGYSTDAAPDPYWIDLFVEVAYKEYVAGGFQAAWARNANTLIGVMQ